MNEKRRLVGVMKYIYTNTHVHNVFVWDSINVYMSHMATYITLVF